MPAIRTDYQTPIQNMGNIAGQTISRVGDIASNAIIQAPKAAREERLAARKELQAAKQEILDENAIQKFHDNEEYRISEIERYKTDLEDYGNKTGMTSQQMDKARARLEALKKAPATTAEKKLATFSGNLMAINNIQTNAKVSGDPMLGDLVQMSFPIDVDNMFDSDEYGKAATTYFQSATEKRKQARITDMITQISKENPDAPREMVTQKVMQQISNDPFLGSMTASDMSSWINSAFESKGEIEKRGAEKQKAVAGEAKQAAEAQKSEDNLKVNQGRLGVARGELALKQQKAKAETEKLSKEKNKDLYTNIIKQRDRLLTSETAMYNPDVKKQTENYSLILNVISAADELGQELSLEKASKIANDIQKGDTKKTPIHQQAYTMSQETSGEQGDGESPWSMIPGSSQVGRSAAIPGTPTAEAEAARPSAGAGAELSDEQVSAWLESGGWKKTQITAKVIAEQKKNLLLKMKK